MADNGQHEAWATSAPRCVLTMYCSVERKSLISTRMTPKPSCLSDEKEDPNSLFMPFSWPKHFLQCFLTAKERRNEIQEDLGCLKKCFRVFLETGTFQNCRCIDRIIMLKVTLWLQFWDKHTRVFVDRVCELVLVKPCEVHVTTASVLVTRSIDPGQKRKLSCQIKLKLKYVWLVLRP